ncbi:hypothetical protein [Saccharopolyspora sp. 5N708]|uniref:hypothetical protein n=1 Tax=Saccharopolyspora sp. 5N708 TaxID=3457424 RepID=UPI003FD6666E
MSAQQYQPGGQQPRPMQTARSQIQPHSAQAYPPQPYPARLQAHPQQPARPYSPQPSAYPAGPYPLPHPYFFQRKAWRDQAKRVFLTVVVPWMAARFLLKPKTGERLRDRKLTLLASWRAVLAVLAVALATVNFRQPWETLPGSWDTLTHIWLPAALLAPVLFVVLLAVTRSGHRTKLLPGALRLWRLLLGVFCIALSLLVLWPIGAGVEPTGDDNALTYSLGVLVVYGWFPLFGCCAVYWGARSGLWLGEIHSLLGPIGSTLLMLLITGQEMVELDSKGLPLPWWFVLIGCGVVGTLVLAVFEFRRARVVGFRFRGGPQPVPGVAVADSGVVLSEAPALPRGLRDPARRRPFWIRAEAFPKTVAAVDVPLRRWGRVRGIAAAVGNTVATVFRPVAAFFAAAGRWIAKPVRPIVRSVQRKRSARRDSAGPGPTAAGVLAIVVFPWLTARFLFKPEVGASQRDWLLDRLGFWRTVAGLAVVVLTTIRFQGEWGLAWNLAQKGLSTIGLALLIAPLAILMALDARQNGYGLQLWDGFMRMVKRGALGLFVAIPLPLGIIGGIVFAVIASVAAGPVGLLALPLVPLGVVALLWCVPFLVCTFYWAIRSCLWMSEVNPLLAPVAATVFAVSISIEEIATISNNNVPIPLWLVLNIFGLITTVLLGTAEYRHASSLGYRLLRAQETTSAPINSQQPSSGIVRPMLRDLRRLAHDHFHYVQQTDR